MHPICLFAKKNKEDVTQAPEADNVAPDNTAKTDLPSPSSDSIIPNDNEKVNKKTDYKTHTDSDSSFAEQVQKSAKKQLAAALKEAGVDGKGTITQTPEGYAAQIVHVALTRTGKMDMSDIMMRANKRIGEVYTAFVDEGKYGGKEILKGGMTYQPITDKSAVAKADEAIKNSYTVYGCSLQ